MRKLLFKTLFKRPLTEPRPERSEASLAELAQRLEAGARRALGRSLSIRQVDAGSCNGCELEIHALNNVYYDLERFGLRFVASPRHADALVVTGPVSRHLAEAFALTDQATPRPRLIIAVGDCACDGGFCAGSFAVMGGVSRLMPVDVRIPGCPPRPVSIVEALLAALGQGHVRAMLKG